jgi:hypothetical protein
MSHVYTVKVILWIKFIVSQQTRERKIPENLLYMRFVESVFVLKWLLFSFTCFTLFTILTIYFSYSVFTILIFSSHSLLTFMFIVNIHNFFLIPPIHSIRYIALLKSFDYHFWRDPLAQQFCTELFTVQVHARTSFTANSHSTYSLNV